MARHLTSGWGETAGGGVAAGIATGRKARLLRAAVFFLVLTLSAGLATAGPADRYTKDKVKAPDRATSAPAAAAPAPEPEAKAVADEPAPNFAKASSKLALGTTSVRSPADFQECVRVALAQSPLLTKSSIEIESRRLDVGDAYSQYIPTIVLSTTFYLRLPEYKNTVASSAYQSVFNNSSSDATQNLSNSISAANAVYAGNSNNRNRKTYDLNFTTGAWNPMLTAFEVQAKKELVNIAVLSHLKVIDQGLLRLGTTFLQLGMAESMLNLCKEKEDLAVKNLEYAKTKTGQIGRAHV